MLEACLDLGFISSREAEDTDRARMKRLMCSLELRHTDESLLFCFLRFVLGATRGRWRPSRDRCSLRRTAGVPVRPGLAGVSVKMNEAEKIVQKFP